jgi:hypothetical protein
MKNRDVHLGPTRSNRTTLADRMTPLLLDRSPTAARTRRTCVVVKRRGPQLENALWPDPPLLIHSLGKGLVNGTSHLLPPSRPPSAHRCLAALSRLHLRWSWERNHAVANLSDLFLHSRRLEELHTESPSTTMTTSSVTATTRVPHPHPRPLLIAGGFSESHRSANTPPHQTPPRNTAARARYTASMSPCLAG